MSQAFVKEGDGQWLHDIAPTINALVMYLTRDNNNIKVYVKKNYFNPELNKEVYEMSDGLAYAVGDDNKWYILPE